MKEWIQQLRELLTNIDELADGINEEVPNTDLRADVLNCLDDAYSSVKDAINHIG